MDEALNELKSLHEQIISILPKSLHEFDISKKSRIPFKVETLKGVLLHRISDLCSTSIGLIEEHKKLESILLIRAIQESVALLYLLYLEIKKTCEKGEIKDFDSFIMRLLFGSKLKNTKVKADTILNAIDKLDKLIPKFRKHYDILSEYAHPNSFGTFISFGKLDKENKTFYFGSKSRDKEINGSIFTFLGSIQLTIQINNNIEKYYPKFFQICESSIR